MTASYTISVTLIRPVRQEEWNSDYPVAEHLASYTDGTAKRALEREILRAMRVIDGDADCEVLTAQVHNE